MVKLEYSPKVEKAIQNDEPIVALESTIITHGMPWPGPIILKPRKKLKK